MLKSEADEFPSTTTMHHSTAPSDLRSKLSRIASRQKQLKISFNQLNSQIRTGLLEAEDVFASLAIPLMKLVGLKTVEMADEGRFSSVIININKGAHSNFKDWPKNRDDSEETSRRSVLGIRRSNDDQRERNYGDKAAKVCKELMGKQQLQLMQLVQLLKQIEIQVNSGEDDILQTLADRRASLQTLFQKAVAFVSAIHETHQSNGMSFEMVKLLKFMFAHVGSALGSVEVGVENLIGNLAERMCQPMVKYVNCLKAELVSGTCPNLLAMVEEMEGAMRLRSLELEEARKKVRAVEESRLDALNKLKESEGRLKEMMERQVFTLEANNRLRRRSVREKSMKLLSEEADPTKDETLLWELLRKKRKLQIPESPFGPQELPGVGANTKNLKSTRVTPPIRCKPISTSHSGGLRPRTPRMDFLIPLGSSPSTQVLQHKLITP